MTIKSLFRSYASPNLIRTGHKFQAMLANAYYGFPSRRLRIVGVTGTNGKTTTSHLIGAILQRAGYETAIASTVAFQIGDQKETNVLNMTTPSPWVLQGFLAKAVRAGAHMAVVETTSHAIDQERVWGIHYDIVVLTNLTHDHLDYHKTFEAYRQAKLRLFAHRPRVAVVNTDDASAGQFLALPASQQITYGIEAKALVTARKMLVEPSATLFTVVTPIGQIAINLALPGRFNVANALAAIAVGVSQGIGLETIKQALESVTVVPGRMERVDVGQDFVVLIDYAHTPDAFEQIYATLKPVTKGRLIHVFGATGDRDRTKRPIMGALAARSADYTILTSDEPYSEEPEKIIEEIIEGLKRGRTKSELRIKNSELRMTESGEGVWWERITDRKAAIARALELGKKDDVVIITGMGDERWMTIGDGQGGIQRVPWNERRIVKDLLLARFQRKQTAD
ncbi:MAG: UDP-N-acetylmuramoyl-L-alanyl-D-glutamate--2,6-diaminopimelate ligase [Patescibacteria group bacterium]